jgi:hypothetical protein
VRVFYRLLWVVALVVGLAALGRGQTSGLTSDLNSRAAGNSIPRPKRKDETEAFTVRSPWGQFRAVMYVWHTTLATTPSDFRRLSRNRYFSEHASWNRPKDRKFMMLRVSQNLAIEFQHR